MDRRLLTALLLGFFLLLQINCTCEAGKVADKDMPQAIVAGRIAVKDAQAAMEYCRAHGLGKMSGLLGQFVTFEDVFPKLDLDQPIRFEMCIDPKTEEIIQVMGLGGDHTSVAEFMEMNVSAVPGYDDLLELTDDDDSDMFCYLLREKSRSHIAVCESKLAADVAFQLLQRFKKDDKRSSKYQWSILSKPCEIHPGKRKQMLTALNLAASVQLQKRDDEEPLDHQLRSFWGKTKLAILNTFFEDCEYLEAGFIVHPDQERGKFELTVKARENSTLDRWMTKTAKTRSPFAGILQDETRTSIGLSLELGETQKKSLQSLMTAAKSALVETKLSASNAKAFEQVMVDQVKRGQFHAFVQVERFSAEPMQVSGGLHLKNAVGIVPVFNHVMKMVEEIEKQNVNSSVRSGLTESGQPIFFWNNPLGFSRKSTMAITATSKGIWFAFGEEDGERESYQVKVQTAKGEQSLERSRLVNISSPDASDRLENLLLDLQQPPQSRERSFLLNTIVSEQIWPDMSPLLVGIFNRSQRIETRTEAYTVQVPNEDGTMRTETRTRTVSSTQHSGFKNSSTAEDAMYIEASGEPIPSDPGDVKPQRVKLASATSEVKKSKKEKAKETGQISLQTKSIKNGLQIHGEFEKAAIPALILIPDYISMAIGSLGDF